MAGETENQVLTHLQHLGSKLDRLADELGGLKRCLQAVQTVMLEMHRGIDLLPDVDDPGSPSSRAGNEGAKAEVKPSRTDPSPLRPEDLPMLLTKAQAMRVIGVSDVVFRELEHAGIIRSVPVRSDRRYTRRDLEDAVEQMRRGKAPTIWGLSAERIASIGSAKLEPVSLLPGSSTSPMAAADAGGTPSTARSPRRKRKPPNAPIESASKRGTTRYLVLRPVDRS